MTKYYTRACNFYYGINANLLITKKIALPLCGNNNIAFDKVEVISRSDLFRARGFKVEDISTGGSAQESEAQIVGG